jgi:hypothetical protein
VHWPNFAQLITNCGQNWFHVFGLPIIASGDSINDLIQIHPHLMRNQSHWVPVESAVARVKLKRMDEMTADFFNLVLFNKIIKKKIPHSLYRSVTSTISSIHFAFGHILTVHRSYPSHRIASHRIASQRSASHHIASIHTMCQSYYYGGAFWVATILTYYLANKALSCCCTRSAEFERKCNAFIFMLLILIGAVITLRFIYQLMFTVDFWILTTPGEGWSIDAFFSLIITIVYFYVNYLSATQELIYFAPMLTACNLFPYCVIFLPAVKPMQRRNSWSYLVSSIFYVVVAGYEVYSWFPIEKKWDQDHCFLDEFIDIKTPIGFYSTVMIFLIYFMALIKIWITFMTGPNSFSGSRIYGAVMSITLFYNLAAGLALYFTACEYQQHKVNVQIADKIVSAKRESENER